MIGDKKCCVLIFLKIMIYVSITFNEFSFYQKSLVTEKKAFWDINSYVDVNLLIY